MQVLFTHLWKDRDMKSIVRSSVVVLAIACTSGAANAQFSLSAGAFLPKDAKVRAIFGDSTYAYGFGLGAIDRQNRRGVGFDFVGLSFNAPNNHFTTFGTTIGYEVQQELGDDLLGYARAGTGLGYFDYAIFSGGVPVESNRRFASISVAEAGLVLNRNLNLSAQYLFMPTFAGFDFTGIRVQLAFSFR